MKRFFIIKLTAVLTAALILPSACVFADPVGEIIQDSESSGENTSSGTSAEDALNALNAAIALNALMAQNAANAESQVTAAPEVKTEKQAAVKASDAADTSKAAEEAENIEETQETEASDVVEEEIPAEDRQSATENAVLQYIERQKASIEAAREGIERAKEINLEKEKAEIVASMPNDTYIDVDLTNQILTYYKNGMPAMTSDVVTGNASKHNDTPEGVYEIYMKQKGRTLRGPDYETFVNYWMPFTGNYGLHDATWRGAFGGSIYKTAGSHGCVNLPKSAASTLYDLAPIGTKVYVHT